MKNKKIIEKMLNEERKFLMILYKQSYVKASLEQETFEKIKALSFYLENEYIAKKQLTIIEELNYFDYKDEMTEDEFFAVIDEITKATI